MTFTEENKEFSITKTSGNYFETINNGIEPYFPSTSTIINLLNEIVPSNWNCYNQGCPGNDSFVDENGFLNLYLKLIVPGTDFRIVKIQGENSGTFLSRIGEFNFHTGVYSVNLELVTYPDSNWIYTLIDGLAHIWVYYYIAEHLGLNKDLQGCIMNSKISAFNVSTGETLKFNYQEMPEEIVDALNNDKGRLYKIAFENFSERIRVAKSHNN